MDLHSYRQPTLRDSDGCILVGNSASEVNGECFTGSSTNTYKALYELVIDALDATEDLFIAMTNVAYSINRIACSISLGK